MDYLGFAKKAAQAALEKKKLEQAMNKQLLDQQDLNLGVSALVPAPNLLGTRAAGIPVRLLDLSCEGKMAAPVSIYISSTTQTPATLCTGPLRGMVEFGNGSAFAKIEFDIPPPSRFPTVSDPAGAGLPWIPFMGSFQSGVSLSVCASSVRVFAVNDNNLPDITGTIIGRSGVGLGVFVTNPVVTASISYGTTYGTNEHLTRTVYPSTYATDLGIPPFASSVVIGRAITSSVSGTIQNGAGNALIPFSQAPGDYSAIPIPRSAQSITSIVTLPAVVPITLIYNLSL